jgi:hypothetical protein
MNNKIKLSIWKNSLLIRNNKIKLCNFMTKQIGGGKKLKIKYNNYEYVYEAAMDDNYFVLYSQNDYECVAVMIDTENKIAEIHNIDNNSNCLAKTNMNVGSLLLKLTIKMLQKYKNKLNIQLIVLTDNSLKKCKNNNIIFSKMMILLTGNTWYGKYGFKPFKNDTNKLDKILNDDYDKNIDIINTITISKANIIKYIKLTNKQSIIISVEKLVESNPNYLLKDFIKFFITDFDKTCKYFGMFYEQLFKDIGLTDFHHKYFGLKI